MDQLNLAWRGLGQVRCAALKRGEPFRQIVLREQSREGANDRIYAAVAAIRRLKGKTPSFWPQDPCVIVQL
jgi:hypothetical protein